MASRDELYAKFGITAEAAQLLETEITTCLLVLKGLGENWVENPEPQLAKLYLYKIDKMTLGNLQASLRKHLNIGKEDLMFLGEALEARNSLMHGFYEKHNFQIQTDEGRAIMVADLEKKHQVLFDAWQHMTFLGNTLVGALELLKKVSDEAQSK